MHIKNSKVMKKNGISASTFFAITLSFVMIFSFNACSSDSEDAISSGINDTKSEPTSNPYSLVIKTLAKGQDITTKGAVKNATLFVFNENNEFVKQINLDKSILLQRKAVSIDCPDSDRITVIAWGGLSEGENVASLDSANIISDLKIQLQQNNGVVTAALGDLFYGQITLNRPVTKSSDIQTLNIERKVSSLAINTKGVNKKYGTTEGSYYYKVKKSKSSFNYNGELTGNEVEYIIPAYFNDNNELVTETTPILPAYNIVIELYRDNEMIFSSKNAKNGEISSANAGEQVNVNFNITLNNCSIKVTPWNTIIQNVTVG